MTTNTGFHRMFVYGTLRRGCSNDHYLERATLIGEARTRRGFRLHDLGYYPGMIRDHGWARVLGEVYAVDSSTLADVDRLEGHPRYYVRTPIVLDGGLHVETYLLQLDQVGGRPMIRGGDWRRNTARPR